MILHLGSGTYFGLNSVAARIWELVQEPHCVSAISNVIAREYDVERERCERDVLRLLQELADHELVRVHEQAG